MSQTDPKFLASSSCKEWSLSSKDRVFLEELIFRLMSWKIVSEKTALQSFVKKAELIHLCRLAVKSFSQQKPFLEISKKSLPLTICADIHGQFFDLQFILNKCGLPPGRSWLFLGDYVDRGKFGVETFCLLIALKTRYPNNCYMLRGNHEDYNVSMTYGFFDECIEKYGDFDRHLVFLSFVNVFNHMPVAAVINGRVLAMHGGLSPELNGKKDLNGLKKPSFVPAKGLMCDLVWSDPDGEKPGWSTSGRSVSLCYDQSIIRRFCRRQSLELIVRGHQIKTAWKKQGYNMMTGNKLLTLFSAPNYSNFENTSAVLNVSKDMVCQFQLFRPKKLKSKHE